MAKVTTVTLGGTKIEFFNSLMGKERIIVNGEEVSAKSSVTGTEHSFAVEEGGQNVNYRFVTGVNFLGVAFSLYRNDMPVIESPKKGIWGLILTTFVIVALGYLIGKSLI